MATGPLGALSHDELGVIFDGLADPLQPVVAVALSSTCLGLRTPLRAGLEVLQQQHEQAKALCNKIVNSPWQSLDVEDKPLGVHCAQLRDAEQLDWNLEELNAAHMATLGMLFRMNSLPRVRRINLTGNNFGDTAMQALCEGLGHGAAPSLNDLDLKDNAFEQAGAEALAASLCRGAFPNLEKLNLTASRIRQQGAAVLAMPLRKLSALGELRMGHCGIGDEGVASLFSNLSKDDFRALHTLSLDCNEITDQGFATLASTLNAGALPKFKQLDVSFEDQRLAGEGWQALANACHARDVTYSVLLD